MLAPQGKKVLLILGKTWFLFCGALSQIKPYKGVNIIDAKKNLVKQAR